MPDLPADEAGRGVPDTIPDFDTVRGTALLGSGRVQAVPGDPVGRPGRPERVPVLDAVIWLPNLILFLLGCGIAGLFILLFLRLLSS